MYKMHKVPFACWICLLAGMTLAALLLLSPKASAAWPPVEDPAGTNAPPGISGGVNYADPMNWPNDPGFGGHWEFFSFVPQAWAANLNAENKRLGVGSHVDQAFARTIGDRRILVAEIDSGCEWGNAELVNKMYINPGEAPPPMGCPGADGTKHDVNGDGFFNVQDYTTATHHMTPAFTTVCDPRVMKAGDVNKNGILDGEDLINAFSDHVDDDGNGYIDDISGWDFFRNDNDPFDDIGYGHGNGSQTDCVAEGNNGMGDIGGCPECMIESLRLSDTYVYDGSDFAMGLIYAVDSGASVILGEGASITNSPMSQIAVDYCYANGVSFTIDSSDLNSFHHNQPNTLAHTFTVHAIEYDGIGSSSSTTFLNFNNCSNYGSNVPASFPAVSCASQAIGQFSGVMALTYSAALQAGIPAPSTSTIGDPGSVRRLSTEESYQLSINAMDDIYDPADATDPNKFVTKIGWDQRFGYGRVNARKMVDEVFGGRIPPEVELRSPDWWQTLDPATGTFTVEGHISYRKDFAQSVDWVLEWAPGVEPDDSTFKTLAHAEMMSGAMDGPLATWDISQLAIDNPAQAPPDNLVNRYMVTMRLRAVVHSTDPTHDGVKGEARRAIFVHHDGDLVKGFPKKVGYSGESSPKMFDLNGDGKRELILADASGSVHAYQIDGSELPGWPVRTKLIPAIDPASGKGHATELGFTKGKISSDIHSTIVATPAIGDIDGDGKAEVFVADMDGNLYAWHADGTMAHGWPQTVDRSIIAERGTHRFPAGVDDGVFASPAMADFDGDHVNEIVVADMLGEVTVWKGDGTKMPNFPVRVWDTTLMDDPTAPQPRQLNRIMTSPAVGDLNKDGVPDIVVGTNENYDSVGRLYAIDGKSGAYLPGWPQKVVSVFVLPMVGSGVQASPAMADLDGDGVPEIVTAGIGSSLKVFTATGANYPLSLPTDSTRFGSKSIAKDSVTLGFISGPSFGDLDDDGVLDLIAPTVGTGVALAMAGSGMRHDLEHHLSAWDTKTGKFKDGFPMVVEDYMLFHNPTIADVDGDGHSEVVYGSAGYFIHATRADGSEASGFPKFTGQWNLSSPAFGDMDGDGKLEMASVTREGWLFLWHVGGSATGRMDWPSYRHDLRNTGNFATALDQGKGPPPVGGNMPPAPSGCGCAIGSRAPLEGGALLGGLFLVCGAWLAARRRACHHRSRS